MRRHPIRNAVGLLLILVAAAEGMEAQGGRQASGQPAPTAAGPQAGGAGRGGGRGAAGGGAGADGLYAFDPTASSMATLPDGPPVETHQKVTLDGVAVTYTARAGFIGLRNATTGQVAARLFVTSYTKDGASGPRRPVAAFVGGAPGFAAAWQELGGFGPKRFKLAADGTAGAPPYEWVDNAETLLGQADLVFVNPVGTSFSRPDTPGRGPEFWSTAGDVASASEAIRTWLVQNDRQQSPLILIGEDAATGRAAGVALYLIDHQTVVAGVALLSLTPAADATAGDTQYVTLLPSLAVAAWYHKKLAPELQALSVAQIAEQARQFAGRDYLHALYKGDRLPADERAKTAAALARLTGLSSGFIVSNNLRIPFDRFNQELLRSMRHTLSPADARVTGFAPPAAGGGRGGGGFGTPAPVLVDHRLNGLAGGFSTAYEAYLRRELGVAAAVAGPLYLIGGGVSNFSSTGAGDASLAAALSRQPRMRLLFGVGLYDLAVPFYAAEFTIAHLMVAPDVRAHQITTVQLEAGQMPYLEAKPRMMLRDALATFITAPVAR